MYNDNDKTSAILAVVFVILLTIFMYVFIVNQPGYQTLTDKERFIFWMLFCK